MSKGRSIRVLATFVIAYCLLSVSCGDPLSPDGSDVSHVEVSPSSVAITVGETRAVTAQAFGTDDERLSGRRIFWASQDATVASVSQAGIITGVGSGNTQIAASAGGKSALVAVSVNARPVSLVRVVPPTASVQVGRTVALAAEALDASGAEVVGRPVSWISLSPNVATVSNAGIVTGVATGQATITATVDGINGSAVVTVSAVPAASVSIVPDNGTLEQGEALQLAAVAKDGQGNTLTGKTASWSSSNESIATVSSTGRVVGISEGNFTITARIDGVSGTGDYSVTKIPVGVVRVTPDVSTIAVGQTQPLTVNLFASDGTTPLAVTGRTVTWETSAPAVATVNLNGGVTGVSAGVTTITATVEGVAGTATVNVTVVPIASITLTPDPATVEEGSTLALLATVLGTNGDVLAGRQLFWASDNPLVSVSQTGVVTALIGAGSQSATISASAPGGGVGGGTPSDNVVVSVSYAPVNAVTLSPSQQNLSVGGSTNFGVALIAAGGQPLSTTGRTITWLSLDPAIATVAPNGTVTGVASGIARIEISASSPGQATPAKDTAQVNVQNQSPVGSVVMSVSPPGPQILPVTFTGTITVRDAGNNLASGRDVTISASPAGVVTINPQNAVTNASGVVTVTITGVAKGTALVTATSETVDGTATVNVLSPVAQVALTVSPSSVIGTAAPPVQATVVLTDGTGAVVTRPVTWSSLPPTVASVNSSGLITPLAVGSTVIRATSEGVFDEKPFDVLAPVASVTVTAPDSSAAPGATVQASAALFDASNNPLTGRTVAWGTGDANVATVSATGLITAVGVGNTTITATAEGVQGSMPFDVQIIPASSVVVSPTNPSMVEAGTLAFTAQVLDAGGIPVFGHTIVWSTSGANKVMINPTTGVATAVDSTTTTTVTATATPGTTPGGAVGSTTVTVTNLPVSAVGITPASTNVAPLSSTNLTVHTDRAGGPARFRACTLAATPIILPVVSLGQTGGTTDANGNLTISVTGLIPGQATVTATCEGIQGTATVNVP